MGSKKIYSLVSLWLEITLFLTLFLFKIFFERCCLMTLIFLVMLWLKKLFHFALLALYVCFIIASVKD